MDYISSSIHEYQPILLGAGCLALGYMYGRHCRCIMETQGGAPKMSDAACCAGTESFNYISEHAAVDPETMAMVRQWLNPAEADWVREFRQFRLSHIDLSPIETKIEEKSIQSGGYWLRCRITRTES